MEQDARDLVQFFLCLVGNESKQDVLRNILATKYTTPQQLFSLFFDNSSSAQRKNTDNSSPTQVLKPRQNDSGRSPRAQLHLRHIDRASLSDFLNSEKQFQRQAHKLTPFIDTVLRTYSFTREPRLSLSEFSKFVYAPPVLDTSNASRNQYDLKFIVYLMFVRELQAACKETSAIRTLLKKHSPQKLFHLIVKNIHLTIREEELKSFMIRAGVHLSDNQVKYILNRLNTGKSEDPFVGGIGLAQFTAYFSNRSLSNNSSIEALSKSNPTLPFATKSTGTASMANPKIVKNEIYTGNLQSTISQGEATSKRVTNNLVMKSSQKVLQAEAVRLTPPKTPKSAQLKSNHQQQSNKFNQNPEPPSPVKMYDSKDLSYSSPPTVPPNSSAVATKQKKALKMQLDQMSTQVKKRLSYEQQIEAVCLKKTVSFLLALARREKQINALKSQLFASYRINPFKLFLQLDTNQAEFLTSDQLRNYFSQSSDLIVFLYGSEGVLPFSGFVKLLVPSTFSMQELQATMFSQCDGDASEAITNLYHRIQQSEAENIKELQLLAKEFRRECPSDILKGVLPLGESLSHVGLQSVSREQGIAINQKEIDILMRKFDRDADGTISLQDFTPYFIF